MANKSYEKSVARLVQEATGAPYMVALRWTKEHIADNPTRMDRNHRAFEVSKFAKWSMDPESDEEGNDQ